VEDAVRYPVRIRITAEDRTGILADIVTAIANIDTYIREVRAEALKGRYGEMNITVEVRDTRHLDKIVNHIKTIRGVRQIERIHPPVKKAKKAASSQPSRTSKKQRRSTPRRVLQA
ncbi:MAG: ACT domain-containing protein, partial [Acidobacteriota bacterium]